MPSRIGRSQPAPLAIARDPDAPHDGIHAVDIALGVGEPLQDDDAYTLAESTIPSESPPPARGGGGGGGWGGGRGGLSLSLSLSTLSLSLSLSRPPPPFFQRRGRGKPGPLFEERAPNREKTIGKSTSASR